MPTVTLYWIPLGTGPGSALVRLSGRLYEGLAARRAGRPPRPLFHSALVIRTFGGTHSIEMAPVWSAPGGRHGQVAVGPVGMRPLGRSRWFRYEVRCWRDGVIPDLQSGCPVEVPTDAARAAALLDLVPSFPCCTWGRDEQRTGEMWNSNSLTSWLLLSSGHDVAVLQPPDGGRAPGWSAGVTAAARAAGRSQPVIVSESGSALGR